MTHVRVWVDGRDVTCTTLAQLRIAGGRGDKLSRPEPATCGLQATWPVTEPLPVYGSRVDVAGWLPGRPEEDHRAALFTGMVTDVAMEGDMVSLLAVDPMRTLDGLPVGDTPWPIEAWRERVAHVWDAARASAGTPPWMPTGLDLVAQLLVPPYNGFLWSRDVDRQPALELLYHYLDPWAAAVYYRPSTLWPAPPDPADWAPLAQMRHGFQIHGGHSDPRTLIPSCQTAAEDPAPRMWQSTTQVVNNWTLAILNPDVLDADGRPTPVDLEAVDQKSKAQYGPRASKLTTELMTTYLGVPQPIPQDLVDGWLTRTRNPAWLADNLTALLNPDTIAADPAAAGRAWRIVAHGPAATARYTLWEGLPGSSLDPYYDRYEWMCEALTIDWTHEGWEIGATLTPPSLYDGTAATVDPRNSYGEVTRAHPTYTELMTYHPTYADLVTTPHPHPTPPAGG